MTYHIPPKRFVTLHQYFRPWGEGESFVPSLPSNLAKFTGTDTCGNPGILNSLLGAGGSAEMALVPEQRTAQAGFDPVFGARSLKRAIQSQIENPLAKEILEGHFGPRTRLRSTAGIVESCSANHRPIRTFTQLAGLLLGVGLEPCLKAHPADARVVAGDEGLIVQFRTGVT